MAGDGLASGARGTQFVAMTRESNALVPNRTWHRHYDPGVPTTLTFGETTLVDFFTRSVREYGDRPAIIFLNRRLMYRELDDQVRRLAHALEALGVARGTRVAIHMPNVPQFVVGYYATLLLGAVAVPTNPMYTAREIEHQWNDAGCDVAIVMDFIYDQKIRQVRDRLPVRQYIIASIPDYLRFPLDLLARLKLRREKPPLIASVEPTADTHLYTRIVRETAPGGPLAEIDVDDVCTLLYTGGTTGISKGAALTHGNLAANVQQLSAWLRQAEPGREVILCALPLFHSFGLTVVMNESIALGAVQVMIPNPRDIKAIVRSITKHRVTLFPAVPNHFNSINHFPRIERRDLSSIKACLSGSAPLPVDVLETFERMTGSKISEGFGLTETSPVTHSNPLVGIRKVGSIGIPLPGTDAKIVDIDDETRELAPNEVGELAVRGPQVMRAYWGRPDATTEMVRDGWLYTGDLARIDRDGFCFIEGRKKDMILCSGFNVYPDEIDRILIAHPAVMEAATIGVPDDKRGETVKSFVVLREGVTSTAREITDHCRENLAPYKVPREVEFIDELPKSSVLKVLRRELRERELRRRRRG